MFSFEDFLQKKIVFSIFYNFGSNIWDWFFNQIFGVLMYDLNIDIHELLAVLLCITVLTVMNNEWKNIFELL